MEVMMGVSVRIFKRFRDKWRQRNMFLYWPLETLKERVSAIRDQNLFCRIFANTNYPFSAIRYWWVRCAISDEAIRLGRPLTVLDAGCGNGKLRIFIGKIMEERWVGIDWHVDAAQLKTVGYDEVHACDLDGPLPLPDHSADIIVFIHVIEHLPRPSFTMAELSRVIRPGGLLLAGSPVAPIGVACFRQWQHQRQLRAGVRKPGDHIQSFWPGRWRRLVNNEGFILEVMSGAYFCRGKRSPLENYRWWVRMNQVWGAIFPSLGSELYLAARKQDFV